MDPALDYDPSSGAVDTKEVVGLLGFVKEKGYVLEKIVETHVHADHLTGAQVWKKVRTWNVVVMSLSLVSSSSTILTSFFLSCYFTAR